MRHAYGNADVKPNVNTYGDGDGNGNGNINTNSYGSGHSYTYSYSRHTVTHTNLCTRGHTWAVGYCRARASRSLSRWWMHRWDKCLRIRRR